MRNELFFVNSKICIQDIKKNRIFVSKIGDNIFVGPKICRAFCLDCYNLKIGDKSKFENNIIQSEFEKKINKLNKQLKPNQIGIIKKNGKIIKKYLFPAIATHECNILNTNSIKNCTYKNTYGLLKVYKYTKEKDFFIYRGVLDINHINEDYITVSGKSKKKRDALVRFFGEAFERYVSQLYIPQKIIKIKYFSVKKNILRDKDDWTKNNMTTVGLASHKSKLRAIKKGFYENIEHICLRDFIIDKNTLYEFKNQNKFYKNVEIKQLLLKNEFHIPMVITLSKFTHGNPIFGIGISAQESVRKARRDSLYESLQILYEKKYKKIQSLELSCFYERMLNTSYKKVKANNSVFFIDFLLILLKGFEYTVTIYISGLKKNHIIRTAIKKKRDEKKMEFSNENINKKRILEDCGFF